MNKIALNHNPVFARLQFPQFSLFKMTYTSSLSTGTFTTNQYVSFVMKPFRWTNRYHLSSSFPRHLNTYYRDASIQRIHCVNKGAMLMMKVMCLDIYKSILPVEITHQNENYHSDVLFNQHKHLDISYNLSRIKEFLFLWIRRVFH